MDTGAHTFTHPHAQALSRALQNEDQMKEMTHLPAFLLLGNLLPHLAPRPYWEGSGRQKCETGQGSQKREAEGCGGGGLGADPG